MIKYIKILGSFLMLFALMAPSCNEDRITWEEKLLNESKDKIRAEFEMNTLSEASLFVFETTAKQNLSDISDYLQVLKDSALDISFRTKAAEMIGNAFISKDVPVLFSYSNMKLEEEKTIEYFIISALENDWELSNLYFDSIRVNKPLSQIADHTYEGSLQFQQKFLCSSLSEERVYSYDKVAVFYLLKEEKIFGTDTLNIWNIRFGEIRNK